MALGSSQSKEGVLAEPGQGALVYSSRVAHSFLRASLAEPVARARKFAEVGGLVFLVLAVGTLLFRPADLVPALTGVPIYEGLILACLTLSFPRVLAAASPRSLKSNAIAVLLLYLVPAVMLSHLAQGSTYDARLGGVEMLKASIFFFMIIALVDSVAKLHAILAAMVASIFAMTALAVLQHHGFLHLPALEGVVQSSPDGVGPDIVRLCGIGVFNDPNDFSMILVIAGAMCAYGLGARRAGLFRWLLLVPLALFVYALFLTQSRGGLASGVAAGVAFLAARIGWRNTLPLLLLAAPMLLIPSWRQTSVNIDNPEDTFQTRLGLWSDSLEVFRSSPFTGIGQGKLVEAIGQVSHNSYVHAFAELGLLGGIAFTGAVYLCVSGVRRVRSPHPELARMQPYMLATVVCYAIGLLSLSRCYTVPTQLVIGLSATYLVIASRSGGSAVPRWSWGTFGRSAGIGVLMLLSTHIFVQVMLHRA